LCIEGFGMLLGGKGGGRGGGWVGGCDGRDSILPPFVRIFFCFFERRGDGGFGKPEGNVFRRVTGSGCVLFPFFVLRYRPTSPLPPTLHFPQTPFASLPHGITNAPAPARFLDDRQVAQLMRVRQHLQLAPPLGVRGEGVGVGGYSDVRTQSPALETRIRLFTHTQHANGSNPDPVPVWQMKLLLFVIHVKCASEKPSLHHTRTSSPDQSPFIP